MIIILISIGVLLAYWHIHNKEHGGLIPYVRDNKITAIVTVVLTVLGVVFRDAVSAFIGPFVAMAVITYMTASLMDKIAKIIEWIKGLFNLEDDGEEDKRSEGGS